MPSRVVLGLLLAAALLASSRSSAVDDFESSQHGWTGHTYQDPCTVPCTMFCCTAGCCIAGPGPTQFGASREAHSPPDPPNLFYLLLRAVGPHFVETWNYQPDHTGNFLLAGVNKVSMDLSSRESEPGLVARVGIQGPGLNKWVTSDAYAKSVPASAEWIDAEFLLYEPCLTQVSGSDSLSTSLSNVSQLRVFHATSTQWAASDGPQLGIDNIELPEPGTVSGFAAGAALLAVLVARLRR